jgi:hypothetical protein
MINIFRITILFILLINFVKCKKCKKYIFNEFEDYDICNNYITVNTEIIDTQYLISTKIDTLEKTKVFTNTIYLTETINNEITDIETLNYTNTIYLTNIITDNIISTKTINLTNIEISLSTIIESNIESIFMTETLTTSVIIPTCLPDTPNKCSNGCTNIMKDINNCGECGNTCNINNSTSYCNNGLCEILICNTGYTQYNNTCINLNNDINNCGKHDNICPNGFDCFNGLCSSCAEMVNSNSINESPGGQACDIQLSSSFITPENCNSYCSSIGSSYSSLTRNPFGACEGGPGPTCSCCICYDSSYIFNPEISSNCVEINNIKYGEFNGGGPFLGSGSEYIYII